MSLLYPDAWSHVCQFLEPWDIVNLSATCRSAYRAMRRSSVVMEKVSWPFKKGYKLTSEQFKTLREMLESECANKIIDGKVGSGKTWVAVAYAAYKQRRLSKTSDVMIIFAVPPTNISQWDHFIKKYTRLEAVSNHHDSAFYVKDRDKLDQSNIFLTSLLKAGKLVNPLLMKPFILVHDECHNETSVAYRSECVDYVGFTASAKDVVKQKSVHRTFEIFNMTSEILDAGIPPIQYQTYEYTGLPLGFRSSSFCTMLQYKFTRLSAHHISSFQEAATYGALQLYPFKCKVGKKKVVYVPPLYHNEGEVGVKFLDEEAICSEMLKLPKIRSLLALCTLVKELGEKIIIFDIDSDYLSHLFVLLNRYDISTFAFTGLYSSSERPKQIEKFKAGGTALLGSIKMLSEGHNITEANHIVFMRYPRDFQNMNQAIGRAHRYPQKKTVTVHWLFSCELEAIIGLQVAHNCVKRIKAEEIQELLDELKNA